MYLYFDRAGTLKEIYNPDIERVGNSDVNKLFIYWELAEDLEITGLRTRYKLEDNSNIPTTPDYVNQYTTRTTEIPFDKKQDLKFFKFYKNYTFYVVNIPDEVLSISGAVMCSAWFVSGTQIYAMGRFSFAVDGDSEMVNPTYNISVAEWNMLLTLLKNNFNFFAVDTIVGLDLSHYNEGSMIWDLSTGKLWKLEEGELQEISFPYLTAKTTSGKHVYSHNGSLQGELGLDTEGLSNDDNHVPSSKAVATAISSITIPVQSVNNKTGAVVLDATDIKLSTSDSRTIKFILDNIWENFITDAYIGDTAVEKDGNALMFPAIIDNLSSTSGDNPLSAKQGKLLNDRIDNLSAIGRFLAIWNASTGSPTSEPPTSPYTYRVGDYYRVGVSGTRNPKTALQYITGQTNYETGETLSVGDVVYVTTVTSTGTVWAKQSSSGGTVQDVQINGASILSGGIANIPKANASTLGVFKLYDSLGTQGIKMLGDGSLAINNANRSAINTGTSSTLPIVPATQGLSTKKSFGIPIDENTSNTTWTNEERAIAKNTLGIPEIINVIPTYSGVIPDYDITLANNTRFVFDGVVASINVNLPTGNVPLDFMCELVIPDSGLSTSGFTYPSGIEWSGDGVTYDGTKTVFTPLADITPYNILFFNNGSAVGSPQWQAVVRAGKR